MTASVTASVTADGWRIDRARNGQPALRAPDGSWAESRFAPDVDASRRVADAGVRPGDRVLVLGGGAGTLPSAAAAAADAAADAIAGETGLARGLVVVAEPDPAIRAVVDRVLAAGAESPAAASWSRPGLLRLEPPGRSLADFIGAVLANGPYDRVIVHPHLSLPAGFESLKERLDDLEVRRRSGHKFQGHLRANIDANRERFLAAPGVGELAGVLLGEEIVVAGGGPSLAAAASRFGADVAWIAVGTALGTLDAAGIRPQLVVITDPQPFAARPLVALPAARRPPLVAFPTTSAAAVAAAGALIAAFPEDDGGRALEPIRREVGELPAGGSVVTTAIGLGWLLGASRIILAGVDLVETTTRTHADGTSHENARLGRVARFASLEHGARDRNARLRDAGDAVEVITASGAPALSRKNLVLYGRAIGELAARRPEIPLIQANPAALRIPGVLLDPALRPRPASRRFDPPAGMRRRVHGNLL